MQHSYLLALIRGSMHLLINICVPKREVSYDVPLRLDGRAWQHFVWCISRNTHNCTIELSPKIKSNEMKPNTINQFCENKKIKK